MAGQGADPAWLALAADKADDETRPRVVTLLYVMFLLGMAISSIIIGWQTRFVALLLAGICLMSALIFHANFADQNEMIHFMKNVALTGGFLFLVAHGGGNYALDNRARAD